MENPQVMKRLWIAIFLIGIALSMYSQQWAFWIDEYTPAEQSFLQGSQSVMVVNNALTQPAVFGHSVAVDGSTTGSEEVPLDEAPLHCLFAMTQFMDESAEYQRVELLERTQNTSSNYYSRHLLTPSQMQSICQQYEVDALLILNQLVLYNLLESFATESQYGAYLQAYSQAHWTVYHATGTTHSLSTADTLLWESNMGYTRAEVLRQLPSTQEALLYLAREAGIAAAQQLTPSWQPTRRYLYDYDSQLLQAGFDAFRLQRWQEAIQLWLPCLDGKDKKAAACAAANIAIAYEMLGDYALACDYAQRASRLFGAWKTAYGRQQQVNIRYYLAQLQTRQARERGR